MEFHSVVSWTALMLGCAETGQEEIALELFAGMELEPDSRSFVAALKACANVAAKEGGRDLSRKVVKALALKKAIEIEAKATGKGHDSDIFLASSLVNLYCKCGSAEQARRIFESMPVHSMVTVNALMLGYAENGEGKEALKVFANVKDRCTKQDHLTFVAAAKACASVAAREAGIHVDGKFLKVDALEKGMFIHNEAANCGCDSNSLVRNTMLDMYCKCGSVVDARRLFERHSSHNDVVSWNNLILGLTENGDGELALQLFGRMASEGSLPDARTFVAAFKACTILSEREEGSQVCGTTFKLVSLKTAKEIHSKAVKSGCDLDLFVASTMIDMYAKCGSLKDAEEVFRKLKKRDVVVWTTMMLALAEHPERKLLVFDCLDRMQLEGCIPNSLTFVAALKVCAMLAAEENGKPVNGKIVKVVSLEKGSAIHSRAEKQGCESDILFMNTTLAMYAKCGSMVDAARTFDRMPRRTVVSWNTLIMGYVETGEAALALHSLSSMQRQGFAPNAGTFVALLKACGSVVALQNARQLHGGICRYGLESHEMVANSLVDVYGKCGSMTLSHQVFDSARKTDLVTWNALLTGYSREGNSEAVFSLFSKMRDESVKPDVVTFVCVLASCSHAGLVERGKRMFQAMVSKFEITPVMEHYNCLVDALGRGNQVEAALSIVERMPFKPNAVTWRTVLSACRKWSDGGQAAKLAFESLIGIEKGDGTPYLLMANLHAAVPAENGKDGEIVEGPR